MRTILIGTGMVAKTHLLALRDNTAGVRLTAVMGRDPDRTAAFAQQAAEALGHPVAVTTDPTGHDLAIVATPPDSRADLAHALAASGMPTLMEKPVERNHPAARAIVDTYARARVPLGILFQHRTRQAARHLRAALPALGDIVHVDIRVPWWRPQSYYDAPGRGTFARDGGGVMISQAIHTLDLATWLCGPVARLQAQMRTTPLHRMEAEDIATALLTFASGASGLIAATTAAYPGGTESISITTTTAQATLSGDNLTILHHDGRVQSRAASDTGTGGGADPMAFTHAWHQTALQDFANAVRDGHPPPVSGADALHVHAIIDTMRRAAASGRTEAVPQ